MRRLKILFVITRLIHGGAQKMVLALSGELSKKGHAVTIACGPQTGAEGTLLPYARQLGFEVITIKGLVREEHPLKDLSALLTLYNLIDRKRFDVVHTHTSKAGIIGRIAAKFAGTPVIVHSPHGHIFSPGANIPGVSGRKIMTRVFWLAEKTAVNFCDKLIALTEMEKQDWIRLGIAQAARIEVVHNSIPLDEFNPDSVTDAEKKLLKSELGLDSTAKVVSITGRLASEKGHDCLLDAMKIAVRTMPGLTLLVIGEGPERTALESMTKQLGLEKNVRFLGLRHDIKHLLSITDLFVLASRYEGFGLVLIEAMAMKVPVVATRVGGIPEIVRDGYNGMLVGSASPDELASKITELLQNSEKADRIALAGHEYVLKNFSQTKMADKIEDIYFNLAYRRQI